MPIPSLATAFAVEGVETMHEALCKNNEDIVQPYTNNKCMNNAGSRCINKVVQLKPCELGESPLDRAIPSQAVDPSTEGVEIRLGGIPKENSCIKIAKKVLLGTLLGDACLVNTSEEKSFLRLGHSSKQLEYLIWKAKKLLPITGKFVYNIRDGAGFGKNSKSKMIFMNSLSSKYLKHIDDDYYRIINKERTKKVFLNVLNRLTPISIAVWYGDDGSLSNNGIVSLATQSFTCDENMLIKAWFLKRFDIEFEIRNTRGYYLHSNKNGSDKFLQIVSPYLKEIYCLSHKIDPSHSAGHLNCIDNIQGYIHSNDEIIRSPNKPGRPFGFKLSKKAITKMSNRLKGQAPWNKGLKGAQIAWDKGIHKSEKHSEMNVRLSS